MAGVNGNLRVLSSPSTGSSGVNKGNGMTDDTNGRLNGVEMK